MTSTQLLVEKDLMHIWHPCSQMKDFQSLPPLVINQAKGSYLYTNRGTLIDAQSSWWCKSLGHGHPAVIDAIKQQLSTFEHVIAANTTHPLLVELGEKLAEISKKQHVFFASDGACAVEIAMKLALHANQLKGQAHRQEFIALKNSYHGETLGTLSVSDLGLYKKPYEGYGVHCHFITAPYVSGAADPVWDNAEAAWSQVLPELEKIKANACAVLVEPIIQGATGMQCYSADFLRKLAHWSKENNLYFIADEIMTGLGRTGKWLACHHAQIEADIVCVSKGLTSGSLPLSCVLIDHSIYELFYDDYEKNKSFLHSHTFSAHALAVSAAVATLNVIEQEGLNEQAHILGQWMQKQFQQLAKLTDRLTNIRSVGAVIAADLMDSGKQRIGYEFYKEALNQGALLRPIGHSLYWLPPLNTSKQTIEDLAEITLKTIKIIYR